MGNNLESVRLGEDEERGSKCLGVSGGENMATARNMIDLSRVCEHTSRIGPKSVFAHIGTEPRTW